MMDRCEHTGLIKTQCGHCNGVRFEDEYTGGVKIGIKILQPKIKEKDRVPHLQAKEGDKECIVDGCARTPESREMCHKHYIQWTKGELEGLPPFVPIKSHARGECSKEGCHEPAKARRLCGKHYGLWYYKNIIKPGKEVKMEVCKTEKCAGHPKMDSTFCLTCHEAHSRGEIEFEGGVWQYIKSQKRKEKEKFEAAPGKSEESQDTDIIEILEAERKRHQKLIDAVDRVIELLKKEDGSE